MTRSWMGTLHWLYFNKTQNQPKRRLHFLASSCRVGWLVPTTLTCFVKYDHARHGYLLHILYVLLSLKVPLEKFDFLLLPVCKNNHWFLVQIKFSSKRIAIIDSLHGNYSEEFLGHWQYVNNIAYSI